MLGHADLPLGVDQDGGGNLTEQNGVQSTTLLRRAQYVSYPHGFVVLRAESVEPGGCQRDYFCFRGGFIEFRTFQCIAEIVLCCEGTAVLSFIRGRIDNNVRMSAQVLQQF